MVIFVIVVGIFGVVKRLVVVFGKIVVVLINEFVGIAGLLNFSVN